MGDGEYPLDETDAGSVECPLRDDMPAADAPDDPAPLAAATLEGGGGDMESTDI